MNETIFKKKREIERDGERDAEREKRMRAEAKYKKLLILSSSRFIFGIHLEQTLPFSFSHIISLLYIINK
jgi:hypothetical protein